MKHNPSGQDSQKGFNFLRKAWHLLGLIFPFCLYMDLFRGWFGWENASRAILAFGLGVGLFILVLLEILRFRLQRFGDFFYNIFGPLMKEEERFRINATLPYFLANFIVILFFPPELAVLSLSFLVVGDPVAAYVGYNFGKRRFSNGKSVEGVVAFLISTILAGTLLLFLFSLNYSGEENIRYDFSLPMFFVVLAGSISAGITEFFSKTAWKGLLDDNLLIPVVSCFVMAVFSVILFDLPWEQVFFHPSRL